MNFAPYHTFALPVEAEEIFFPETFQEALNYLPHADFVVGSGSNIVPAEQLGKLLITTKLRGIEVEKEDKEKVCVAVAAGENWDQWVQCALQNGWFGLENLAAIPGTVGAAPIQNIGAYGVEVSQFIAQVRGYHKQLGFLSLDRSACRFGYRKSLFQEPGWHGQFLITQVVFELPKRFTPNLDYPSLRAHLPKADSARQVYQAVKEIRAAKLPNPMELPNAGSFFKNPLLTPAQYENLCLLAKGESVPMHKEGEAIKVPAGWLLEKSGLKGFRQGAFGTHPKQALVVVHYGGGQVHKLWEFVYFLQRTVYDTWGIWLEPEVNKIGFGDKEETVLTL
ncbi:MAG: UDP-N-acetylmuramate dehydrogenase [Bacteroidia bacterium]